METNTTKTFYIQKLLITFAAWIEIYNIIRTISQTSTMRLILPHRKTQKTPKQEIEKAIKLKNQYYAEKQ